MKTFSNEAVSLAGGVTGAVVVIAVIVAVLVLCVRRRSRQKTTERGRPEVEETSLSNPHVEEDLPDPNYSTLDDVAPASNIIASKMPLTTVASSFSQPRHLDGMFASSSSPYELVDETPQDNGAFCIHPAAASASETPATKDTNPGNEYAVVNKPRGKKPSKTPPPKPPKPKGLSTSSKAAEATAAAAAIGDLYAVVDKSRSKGGNAKKSKSDPPSANASQTTASFPPGLMYADVEEVRSAVGPPARAVAETEYSAIDHVATANLGNDA